VDYEITPNWLLNLDAKWILMQPDVSVNSGFIRARADINPSSSAPRRGIASEAAASRSISPKSRGQPNSMGSASSFAHSLMDAS
jgi:hypothetical protein